MENMNVCSKKIKLNKIINLVWAGIAIALIVLIVITAADFSKYKEIQEFAVTATLAVTDEFDDEKDDYNKLVEKMYSYFNLSKSTGFYNGFYYDNSDVVDARKSADYALGNLIEQKFDIKCYKGSYYFADTSYIEYTARQYYIHFGIWAVPFAIWLIISLLYLIDKKQSLIITEEKVVCKNGKKVVKEFFIRDIKSVKLTKLRGLKIRGSGIRYNINLLKNSDEIKKVIMEYIEKTSHATETSQNAQSSSLDELKKIKELLDIGAITQEEFDKKKKQLLDL